MDSIAIRRAGFPDLGAAAALFDQYRRFQGQAPDEPAAHAFIRQRLDQGDSVVLLAFREGQPAGFAQLYPIFSSITLRRALVLNDLFVAPQARQAGVARALLAHIEAFAWSLDASRISLNVGRGNLPAQRLYEACGWEADRQFHMYNRYPPERP